MKKFLTRLLLFTLLPSLPLMVAEGFLLPLNFFTYRPFEALLFTTPVPHREAFYPNRTISMTEQGDLGYRTRAAVNKYTDWHTDALGLRNDQYLPRPDILIIGDSYISGGGLQQQETLTNQLAARLGGRQSVYNLAPANFENFELLLQEGLLQKPRLIIFSIVERDIPGVFRPAGDPHPVFRKLKTGLKNLFYTGDLHAQLDRCTRFYSLAWLSSRLSGQTGTGVPSPLDPSLLFLQGSSTPVFTARESALALQAIESYKRFCDSLHVEFMFLPMPNKETVYFDLVPLGSQPTYLLTLDSLLQAAGIRSVNTLGIYNQARRKDQRLLYQPDDTHWNGRAVGLVADAILGQLSNSPGWK